MQVRRREYEDTEIPMGPMIDMVFLLLVFFMVTAKPIKQESDIGLSLPGTVSQEESLDIPDEQQIEILADGSVVLNEMVMAAPGDSSMPELFKTLSRFREATLANQAKPLVTIAADDQTTHQRIVDVLNVCARAKITGVTFAGGEGDEGDL